MVLVLVPTGCALPASQKGGTARSLVNRPGHITVVKLIQSDNPKARSGINWSRPSARGWRRTARLRPRPSVVAPARPNATLEFGCPIGRAPPAGLACLIVGADYPPGVRRRGRSIRHHA